MLSGNNGMLSNHRGQPVQLRLMFHGPAISLKSGAPSDFSDNFLACFRYLSENGVPVHTSLRNKLEVRVKTASNENKQNGQEDFTDAVVNMFQTIFGVRV